MKENPHVCNEAFPTPRSLGFDPRRKFKCYFVFNFILFLILPLWLTHRFSYFSIVTNPCGLNGQSDVVITIAFFYRINSLHVPQNQRKSGFIDQETISAWCVVFFKSCHMQLFCARYVIACQLFLIFKALSQRLLSWIMQNVEGLTSCMWSFLPFISF